jgi:hypothetical protein
LLERGGFGKGLNKVPAAACWDYGEIPLSMDARRQTMGLRRNPSLPPRPSLLERGGFGKDLNKVPAAACWDYEEIPLVDMTNRNKANKINL